MAEPTAERVVLPDVNVLVALAWPNHVHHRRALGWWRRRAGGAWATCPATEFGFVRVSSNRHVLPEAQTPGQAILLLERIVTLEGHVFWADDVTIVDSALVDRHRLQGHRQVTDAHLVALALHHGGRVATLDRGLSAVVPAVADPDEVVELVLKR